MKLVWCKRWELTPDANCRKSVKEHGVKALWRRQVRMWHTYIVAATHHYGLGNIRLEVPEVGQGAAEREERRRDRHALLKFKSTASPRAPV